jgi:hypothetical protein
MTPRPPISFLAAFSLACATAAMVYVLTVWAVVEREPRISGDDKFEFCGGGRHPTEEEDKVTHNATDDGWRSPLN